MLCLILILPDLKTKWYPQKWHIAVMISAGFSTCLTDFNQDLGVSLFWYYIYILIINVIIMYIIFICIYIIYVQDVQDRSILSIYQDVKILFVSRHPWNLVRDHSGASTSVYPRSLRKPFRAASQAGQQPQNDTPSMVVIEGSWCLIGPRPISWGIGDGVALGGCP